MFTRFELKDDASSKFWEICVSGATTEVRFGRLGTDGQAQTKKHASAQAAKAEAEKLIAQKLKKGYGPRQERAWS